MFSEARKPCTRLLHLYTFRKRTMATEMYINISETEAVAIMYCACVCVFTYLYRRIVSPHRDTSLTKRYSLQDDFVKSDDQMHEHNNINDPGESERAAVLHTNSDSGFRNKHIRV